MKLQFVLFQIVMHLAVCVLCYPAMGLAAKWIQVGQDIDGKTAGDESGWSTSLSADGSVVAIGYSTNDKDANESGFVRVYKNVSGSWNQIGSEIGWSSPHVFNWSGNSVSLNSDGSILAVGAMLEDGGSTKFRHVRVYQNIQNTWTQVGSDLDLELSPDYSSYSVCLNTDGSIVAVGSSLNSGGGSDAGYVRVYKNLSGVWTQIGTDINGEAINDWFGGAVSLSADGSIIAVGASGNDGNGNNSGHVRIYQYISGDWAKLGEDIDGESADDSSGLGISLSADGSIVAIGAPWNSGNGEASGHVRVFKYISEGWTQLGADINGGATKDYSGWSVSLSADGNIVAVGSPANSDNGRLSGQVKIYKNISNNWVQVGGVINGEAAGDNAGDSISLSKNGRVIAIGATLNDGGGIDSGHVRIYSKYDFPWTIFYPGFLK